MGNAPEYQAQLDWVTTGDFNPDQYSGDERARYIDQMNKILKQWDNQP